MPFFGVFGLKVGLVESRSGDGRVELRAEFTQSVCFPFPAVIRGFRYYVQGRVAIKSNLGPKKGMTDKRRGKGKLRDTTFIGQGSCSAGIDQRIKALSSSMNTRIMRHYGRSGKVRNFKQLLSVWSLPCLFKYSCSSSVISVMTATYSSKPSSSHSPPLLANRPL